MVYLQFVVSKLYGVPVADMLVCLCSRWSGYDGEAAGNQLLEKSGAGDVVSVDMSVDAVLKINFQYKTR